MGTAVLETRAIGDLASAEAAVDAFCGGFVPDVLTASQAADAVRRLSALERKVVAAKGRAARRVDVSSMWKHAGHRNAAEWMASQTGDPVGAAASLLDTAKRLEGCPATADAFAAGEVSAAAAREIVGAFAVDPTAEAGLLAVATKGDHRQLVDSAARVRQAARSAEDEAAKHARLRARRFGRTRTDADGLVILHAGFAPKDWAVHAAELKRATDAEFTRARREGRREPAEAYAADALLAMLTAGRMGPVRPDATQQPADATTDQPTDPPAAEDDHSPPDESSDAPALSPPPLLGPGVKAEILVLVDGIALKRGYVATGERCEIIGVGPVDVDWVNQLLPEAIVHALVHDGVDITTYASATRSIRKAVKLAVKARDWCCVVNGCGFARRTQRDHRDDYAKGGSGSIDNLNLLCQFHHNQKTRDGARLERHGDEWHWWPPPTAEQRASHHPPSDPWRSAVGANLTIWNLDTS